MTTRWDVERTPDGRAYLWRELGVRIDIEQPPAARSTTDVLIQASWLAHEGQPDDILIHEEIVGLFDRRRDTFARGVAQRARQRGIDWAALVNIACHEEAETRRQGVTTAPETETLAALLARELPAAPQIVPGILTTGVWLLGGHPKSGKSWLALGLVLAIGAGGYALGNVPVGQGEALYLALEDTPRRLQQRAKKLLGDEPPPAGVHLRTQWERLDTGGLEALDRWLVGHPACRLVVIDTLAKARPRPQGQGGGRLYDEDYQALEGLAGVAGRHGVCILVAHHLRKSGLGSDDPVELLSGTMGLSGAADGIMVLQRRRGRAEATLAVIGRDLEQDRELALRWDDLTVSWVLEGDAAEVTLSRSRQEIQEALRDAGPDGLSPRDVAEMTGLTPGNVRQLLNKMRKAAQVEQPHRGIYRLLPGNWDVIEGGKGSAEQAERPANVTALADVTAPPVTIGAAVGAGSAHAVTTVTTVTMPACESEPDTLFVTGGAASGNDHAAIAPSEHLSEANVNDVNDVNAVRENADLAPDPLPFTGEPPPPDEDFPLDDDGPPLPVTAYSRCPACDALSDERGLCRRCNSLLCRGCGEPTGSLIRAWCGPCGMVAALGEETG